MFLGSQLHHSNLCLRLHMVSSLCVSIRTSVLQMSSSYKDISHWIRTHTNSIWLHLNLIISGKNTFPNKVIYSKGTWVKTSTCLFVVFFFFFKENYVLLNCQSLIFFKFLFIYLAVSRLSCSRQDHPWVQWDLLMKHTDSSGVVHRLSSCSTQVGLVPPQNVCS